MSKCHFMLLIELGVLIKNNVVSIQYNINCAQHHRIKHIEEGLQESTLAPY